MASWVDFENDAYVDDEILKKTIDCFKKSCLVRNGFSDASKSIQSLQIWDWTAYTIPSKDIHKKIQ